MDAEAIAKGLSEAQRRSVTAFAPGFAEISEAGMQREWADICNQAGARRSFHNTIKPLLFRLLAERTDAGLYRLTSLGLSVRAILLRDQGDK